MPVYTNLPVVGLASMFAEVPDRKIAVRAAVGQAGDMAADLGEWEVEHQESALAFVVGNRQGTVAEVFVGGP